MSQYFHQLKEFILQDKLTPFKELLYRLPLANLPESRSNEFLIFLSKIILTHNKADYLIEVLDFFDKERQLIDYYPSLIKILLILPIELSKKISTLIQISKEQIFIKILYSENAYKDLIQMEQVLEPIDLELWQLLYECITNHKNDKVIYEAKQEQDDEIYDEYENIEVKEYIEKKLEPNYYLPLPTKAKELEYPELPNGDEAIKIIIHNFKADKINLDEKKITELKQFYCLAPAIERAKLLKCGEYDDSEIFRYYGPVNSFSNYKYEEESVCGKYGGCRMFLCNEFEDDEWFKGECITCEKKITEKEKAVRLALIGGGWEGCYCSFGCIRGTPEELKLMENIREQIYYFKIYV